MQSISKLKKKKTKKNALALITVNVLTFGVSLIKAQSVLVNKHQDISRKWN